MPKDPKSIYTGYIDPLNNQKHGHGTKVFKNGDKYVGEWSKDKATGKGKFWSSEGDYYEGYWLDGKANDYGVY